MCRCTAGSIGGCQRESQEALCPIRIGAYNIQNGRNGGLDSILQGMSQLNLDLGVFQETNVTKGIYTRESSGYRVLALEVLSAHSGGVAVFYCAAKHFSVEVLQLYDANSVSFQLALGGQRWYIVGCYLSPYDASTIEDVVAAISQRPRGDALSI